MRTVLHKFSVESRVTKQDVELCVQEGYIKVISLSLITQGTTGQAAWLGYQLVSCLAMLIA